ncbi:single-stranded-DNA-specific exonuclease RecJ [Blautia wexlerae]|mgnify:FL=1|uniref:single-stranded-DNA-specific exonuclease RecJ n=1 Tax=Blautia wexlerae TaxID=418240 RepID=UPI0032C0A807
MSKWFYKNKKIDRELSNKLGIHPAIIKILADRGVETEEDIREFLAADLSKVSDGSELTDMEKGVSIIQDAIAAGKHIRIIGDYDVDGVTSTYILYKGLIGLHAKCDKFIPHRIKDGYGLHENAIRRAREDGVEVILTCDNGIAATDAVSLAKEFGMTVVVTDHHEVPFVQEPDGRRYILPAADAVIDPKRLEDHVFKEICGAVVAWKFMGRLYKRFGMEDEFRNSDFLEMASLGTVCDVMDLQKDNRAIVKAGMKKMQITNNVGMQALMKVLGLKDKILKSYDYGFKIGPCINAEGRLDTANEAFNLLMETDHKKALDKAEEMRKLNVERQDLTKSGMEDAFRIVDTEMKNDKVLVVYIPGIHESIAGIIAGKIRERYNKPAIVLTNGDGDFLKGSGRSIEAYSMFEKLSEVRGLMLGFGGHPLAAGLSLKKENLEEFRKQLNVRCGLTEADFVAKVMIDVVMPVDYLTEGFIRQLDILEPFGKGNEKPVFAQQNVSASQAQIIGKNKNVLKIAFNSAVCRNGVCFHDIEEKERILNQDGKLNDFKMLYYPDLNEWQGTVSIQANVLDIC